MFNTKTFMAVIIIAMTSIFALAVSEPNEITEPIQQEVSETSFLNANPLPPVDPTMRRKCIFPDGLSTQQLLCIWNICEWYKTAWESCNTNSCRELAWEYYMYYWYGCFPAMVPDAAIQELVEQELGERPDPVIDVLNRYGWIIFQYEPDGNMSYSHP